MRELGVWFSVVFWFSVSGFPGFLVSLGRMANVIGCVDQHRNSRDLSDIAKRHGTKLDVLVDVNIGLERCGGEPQMPALELVQQVSQLGGVCFKGLMAYDTEKAT